MWARLSSSIKIFSICFPSGSFTSIYLDRYCIFSDSGKVIEVMGFEFDSEPKPNQQVIYLLSTSVFSSIK